MLTSAKVSMKALDDMVTQRGKFVRICIEVNLRYVLVWKFNQAVLDIEKVIELIKVRVWSWCKALAKSSFSFTDWCLNPVCCLQSVG